MTVSSTAAAILAGGRATRFSGQDKSRLLVDGCPIILRQVEVLRQVAGEIFVVSSEPGRFADLGLPVHADRLPGLGAIGGIHAALEAALAEQVLVVACDLPFLHEGLLRRLVELSHGGDGAWVRTARGVEPLLACYRRSSRARLLEEIEAGRLRAGDLGGALRMISLDEAELTRFGSVERLLANINTPDDYARVQYPSS